MSESAHALELGALHLPQNVTTEDGWRIELLADGHDKGNSDPVLVTVAALMTDGEHVDYDRDGNRIVTVPMQVVGVDTGAMAHGCAALRRELKKPNLITWTQPDDYAPKTDFPVVTSYAEAIHDDRALMRSEQRFNVVFHCAPYSRSTTMTVAEPLEAPGAIVATPIDSCDSATGWSATRSGLPDTATTFWEAGAVGVADLDSAITSPETWTLTRVGAIDFTGTPYLVAELRTVSNSVNTVKAYAGTSTMADEMKVLSMRLLGDGYYQVSYLAPPSVTAVTFEHTSAPGEVWQGLFCRNLSATNATPGSTARQQTRILPVGGTERTPGSLHIESLNGTDALGFTLIHTKPHDGFGNAADLRRNRVAGAPEYDYSDTFSGKLEPLDGTTTSFGIDVNSLAPADYLFAGVMRCSSVGERVIHWGSYTSPTGAGFLGGAEGGQSLVNFHTADFWIFAPLALLSLPSVRSTSGVVQIDVATEAGSGVVYDEMWLFRIGRGCALSVVDTDKPNLWLESPTLEEDVETVWVGDAASGAGRFHPADGLVAQGRHYLTPDKMDVFVATHQTDYAQVRWSYFKQWDLYAAEDGD